jgi:tRNA(adenine34) deaminase
MITKTSYAEKFMSEAISLGLLAQEKGEVPIGCVVVKDHHVIGKGFNQTVAKNNPMAHAEMLAIETASNSIADWRLNSCDLFVTVEPCLMCFGAIVLSRIRSLYYGVPNNESGVWTTDKLNNNLKLKTMVFHGILECQIEQIMKSFFVLKRRGG